MRRLKIARVLGLYRDKKRWRVMRSNGHVLKVGVLIGVAEKRSSNGNGSGGTGDQKGSLAGKRLEDRRNNARGLRNIELDR